MPVFTRRLGNILDKPADHDHQFRDLLREARKLAKLTFDPKTGTLKGRVGLMSASYTREEFDRATHTMAKLFTGTDPGMRLTWRSKLLTMSTEAELKEIWEKIMELRRKTWHNADASVFGLDANSDGVRGVEEGEGDPVVIGVTEEFIAGMAERMFEAMGCVFAGTETKNERYIKTCDTIAKLLQGEDLENDFEFYGAVRNDIDDATMIELRAVVNQVIGKCGHRSNFNGGQPNTARDAFAAPPSSMPNTARGANPTPYPTVTKIVATPRGAPTAVPPPVPAASSLPVVMRGVEVNVEVSNESSRVNPLRMIPTSARPAIPARDGPAQPQIPGLGSEEKFDKYEAEYRRSESVSSDIASRGGAEVNPFDAPTWTTA